MVFFNRINLTFIKRTNLLSRISCSKVCARNMYKKIVVVVPKAPAVLARNAFGPTQNNLNSGISVSQQTQLNQITSNLPYICKILPQASQATHSQSGSPVLTKTATSTISPIAPQTASSVVNKVFGDIINPNNYFADSSKICAWEVVPHLGAPKNIWNKIVYGVCINNSPYFVGRICSTKMLFTNSRGETEYNELVSNTSIKSEKKNQYVGPLTCYLISWLRPYNSFFLQLDPVLDKKLINQVVPHVLILNETLNTDAKADSFISQGVIPPSFYATLLK